MQSFLHHSFEAGGRRWFFRRLSLLGAALVLLLPVAQAQEAEPLELSLEQALELAVERNFSVQQSGFEVDAARARSRQANAVFLPQLSLEYNAVRTNDPLNVFGFRLKQQSVTEQDFAPNLLNNPDAFPNYSAAIQLQQPVLNPGRIKQRSAARNQLRSQREQLSGTREQIRFQVKQQYYTATMSAEKQEVISEALATAEAFEEQAENFADQGMLSREDLLAARQQLAFMLGYGSDRRVMPTDALTARPAGVAATDAETPLDNAFLRAIDHQVAAATDMQRAAQFSFLPSFNLFGSYELNDDEAFGFEASSYMIGANLRWNLFSGFQQIGKAQEAKAQRRQAETMLQEQQIAQQNELEQARRALRQAEKQMAVSREAITQAEENARIRRNRHEEGLERTTDLLAAETRLSEVRLRELAAIFRYNMSVAAIEMLLGSE
ncbi:MAG: TolC family protein [Cyclonatronaceae bacterium]